MKIVLFAPAFAGIAWLRWAEGGFAIKRALQIGAGPILAVGVAGVLFLLHGLSLAPADEAAQLVGHSGESMFVLGATANLRYMAHSALFALPFTLALIMTPFALWQRSDIQKRQKIAIAGLAAMAVTPFYYVNTFPYFYAFLMAPIAAGLGFGIKALSERYGRNLVLAVFAGWGLMVWLAEGESHLDKQRTIQIAASQMFDEPVYYFDFAVALPRHRKANNFLTAWGLKRYMAGLEPKYVEILADKPVPLLLAMEPEPNPSLLSAMTGIPRYFPFFEEDLDALQETYRPAWGPIYVAGVELDAGQTRDWQVWVPGPYKADSAITVDGTQYSAGSIVMLERGMTKLAAPPDTSTGLLWGENILIPNKPVPERPYWTDF